MPDNLEANDFVKAALLDRKRAASMLAAHPEIAQANLYTALVLADVARVEHFGVDVHAKGGPRECVPLIYVCFSQFAGPEPHPTGRFVETARMLLRLGADPNAAYDDERWKENPLPCLYGATGLNNNPELALALLEAGANPNDGESLYHSTEHPDLRCMKLLLEHGAAPSSTNVLNHLLDHEDLAGLDMLLKAGANPNKRNQRGETSLHWAVWRGRGVSIIARLVDGGVELDAQRNDGRTAYALALVGGLSEVARFLEERGANTQLSPLDRFLSNPAAFPERPPELNNPEALHVLSDLATIHQTAAVRALLDAGMPVDARGDHGGTALHWACWKGYPDLVELLLARGASLSVEDHVYHATPPGWFDHGRRNNGDPRGGYPEVERILRAAGATIPQPENA